MSEPIYDARTLWELLERRVADSPDRAFLIDDADRTELLELIEEYRTGLIPLIVPVTLLRHHVRRNEVEYLVDQTYLQPHPKELMLRNHV